MGGSQSSTAAKISARDRAILEVKVQRDRVKQYQKKLTLVTERETEIARDHYRQGKTSLALLTLKKRNYQQQLLEKTQHQVLNLEQLVQSIEFAVIEARVVDGLREGNAILAELQSQVRIEDVELLLAETAEAVAYQNEISQMLSNTENVAIDDAELLNELAALQADTTTDKKTERLAEDIILPSVPTHSPIITHTAHISRPRVEVESRDQSQLLAE